MARAPSDAIRPYDLQVLKLLRAGEGRVLHDALLTRWAAANQEALRLHVFRLRRGGWRIERVERCGYRLTGGRA